MKLLLVLVALLASVQQCLAEMSHLEAAQVLHYYINYDLDVHVNGAGKNTIAQRCKGSGKDGRCNFNEFVNYITTGKSTDQPNYFEVTSDFSFVIGDVFNIYEALRKVGTMASEADLTGRLIKSRRTAHGLFNDLSAMASENKGIAAAKMIDVGSKWTVVKESLKAVSYYSRAAGEGGVMDRLRKMDSHVNWKLSERTNQYASWKPQRIDWRATVAANPDLANRDSDLFKSVALELKGQKNLAASMREQTIATRIADTLEACHR